MNQYNKQVVYVRTGDGLSCHPEHVVYDTIIIQYGGHFKH